MFCRYVQFCLVFIKTHRIKNKPFHLSKQLFALAACPCRGEGGQDEISGERWMIKREWWGKAMMQPWNQKVYLLWPSVILLQGTNMVCIKISVRPKMTKNVRWSRVLVKNKSRKGVQSAVQPLKSDRTGRTDGGDRESWSTVEEEEKDEQKGWRLQYVPHSVVRLSWHENHGWARIKYEPR